MTPIFVNDQPLNDADYVHTTAFSNGVQSFYKDPQGTNLKGTNPYIEEVRPEEYREWHRGFNWAYHKRLAFNEQYERENNLKEAA